MRVSWWLTGLCLLPLCGCDAPPLVALGGTCHSLSDCDQDLTCVLGRCSGDLSSLKGEVPTYGQPDAAASLDAAVDAGAADAQAPDATSPRPDAASPDAARPDASAPRDAAPDTAVAPPDAATPDAATPDAATPDAATPDAAARVASSTEAGESDANGDT